MTVIASTPNLLIPGGLQTVRYTLVALVLGTPTPTSDNITWYFNGGPLPNGLRRQVDVHEILFPTTILPGFAGNYTIEATTTSGSASDTFIVVVTSEWLKKS